uniref:DNA-directed DNA polymerase n=1 Tax=Panagrolaimus sp. JU765 TaxID=591449 RepID=A0AC34R248_9BILA
MKDAFDLKNVDDKPFFPYGFNDPRNYNNILDHLPPKSDYYYDEMTEEKQARFNKWYEENYNTCFDLMKELSIYCEADVMLLTEAVVAFRRTFMDLTQIDPFDKMTLSSACMHTFATHFLKPNQIAIVPELGYQPRFNASEISLKYFAWRARNTGETFQTANSPEGEKLIAGRYRADAFEASKNLIVSFEGCVWHGHDECIKDRQKILPTGKTAEKEFQRFLERKAFIENSGYNVETIWECHVRKELDKNKEMSKFFAEAVIPGYISPRDFLLGGRVSPMALYCKPKDDEEIRWFDIKSLYPSVNFEADYPIGIPEIICVPVNEQNVLWTTPQYLYRGILQENYKVTKFFAAYNYKNWSRDLFAPYVRTFLTQKIQADGWPKELKTEEQKTEFLHVWKNRFGLELDPEKMKKNNAIRSVAKQNLNCLWGKFGQRNDLDETTVTDDPIKLDQILNDDAQQVKSIDLLHGNKVMIIHTRKHGWIKEGKYSNCIIAGWTTSVARLRLFKYLKAANTNSKVLYFDTDSVALLCKKGSCPIKTDLFLGDMCEEYGGFKIQEFVSGGPKQYGLRLLDVLRELLSIKAPNRFFILKNSKKW